MVKILLHLTTDRPLLRLELRVSCGRLARPSAANTERSGGQHGARVSSIFERSPSFDAGLRVGDTLLAMPSKRPDEIRASK